MVVIGCQRAGQHKERVMFTLGLFSKHKAVGCVQQQQAKEHARDVHARIGAVKQENEGHRHNSRGCEPRFVAEKAAAEAVNQRNGGYAAEQEGQLDGDLAVAEQLHPIKEEKLHQGRVCVAQLYAVGDFVGKGTVNGAAEGAELVVAKLVPAQRNEAKGDP